MELQFGNKILPTHPSIKFPLTYQKNGPHNYLYIHIERNFIYFYYLCYLIYSNDLLLNALQ